MKSFVRITTLAIGAVALAAGPALAVTVANPTDKALEITADHGEKEAKTSIDAGKSAKIDCAEGCEIRAVGLNSYGVSVKTGDSLTVKDGMLQHAEAGGADKAKSKKAD